MQNVFDFMLCRVQKKNGHLKYFFSSLKLYLESSSMNVDNMEPLLLGALE